MRAVELEIGRQLLARFGDALIRMQINVLVLDAAPWPFDEHVIDPTALAVHADLDGMVAQHLGEVGTGELTALVGIEDLRRTVLGNRFFQGGKRGRYPLLIVLVVKGRNPLTDIRSIL